LRCLKLFLNYNNLLLNYNNPLLDYNNLLPDYNNPIIIDCYYNLRININLCRPVLSMAEWRSASLDMKKKIYIYISKNKPRVDYEPRSAHGCKIVTGMWSESQSGKFRPITCEIATHECLIYVAKESLTRLISTNHK